MMPDIYYNVLKVLISLLSIPLILMLCLSPLLILIGIIFLVLSRTAKEELLKKQNRKIGKRLIVAPFVVIGGTLVMWGIILLLTMI